MANSIDTYTAGRFSGGQSGYLAGRNFGAKRPTRRRRRRASRGGPTSATPFTPPEQGKLDKALSWLGDAATGVFTVATTPFADSYRAVRNVVDYWDGDDEYDFEAQSDDVVRLIYDDYKNRYGWLNPTSSSEDRARGWENWKSDPFAGALDAISIAAAAFTAGGSLALRSASIGAKAGKVGKTSLALAGLEESAQLSSLARAARTADTAEEAAAAQSALQEAIGAIEAGITADKAQLGPISRFISGTGAEGRVIAGAGDKYYVPRSARLRGPDGQTLLEAAMPHEPLRRILRAGRYKTSEKISDDMPIIGGLSAGRTAGRIEKRRAKKAVQNKSVQVGAKEVGGSLAVAKAIQGLNDSQLAAAKLRHQLGEDADGKMLRVVRRNLEDQRDNVERLVNHPLAREELKYRESVLADTLIGAEKFIKNEDAAARRGSKGQPVTVGVVKDEELLDDLQRANVSKSAVRRKGKGTEERGYAGIAEALKQEHINQAQARIDAIAAERSRVETSRKANERVRSRKRRDSAKGKKVPDTGPKPIREVDEDWVQKQLSEARIHRDIAKKIDAGGLDAIAADLTDARQLLEASHSGNFDLVRANLNQRIALLKLDETDEAFRNPTDAMQTLMRAYKSSDDATAELLGESVDRQDLLARQFEALTGRKPTPEELEQSGFFTSQMATGKVGRTNMTPKRRSTLEQGSKPSNLRFNTGYTTRFALDSITPEHLFRSHAAVRGFRERLSALQVAREASIPVRDAAHEDELIRSGKYEIFEGDADLAKRANQLRDSMGTDLRLLAGGSDEVTAAIDEMDQLLNLVTGDAGKLALPKGFGDKLFEEVGGGLSALEKIVKTPTALFRATTLNLRPAWIAYNTIGQSLLLAFELGPIKAMRYYAEDVARSRAYNKSLKGKALNEREAALVRERELINSQAGGIMSVESSAASELARTQEAFDTGALGRLFRPLWKKKADSTIAADTMRARLGESKAALPTRSMRSLSDAMGRMNQIISDDIPRRAAFMGVVREPAKRLAKRFDISEADAMTILLRDDKMMARVVDRVMGDMIDFSRLSKFEREVVRPLLPFWTWIRGMTVRGVQQVAERPVAAAVGLNAGQEYAENAEERLGLENAPDWMRGAIVSGEDESGQPEIVTTFGMNPWQTTADTLSLGANLVGGRGLIGGGPDNPLAQLNPVFKAPLEVLTGQDFFYGGTPYGSDVPGLDTGFVDNPYTPEDESRNRALAIARRYAANLGPVAGYGRLMRSGALQDPNAQIGTGPTLMRTPTDVLSGYLGAPTSTVNRAAAEQAYLNQFKQNVRVGLLPGEVPLTVPRG